MAISADPSSRRCLRYAVSIIKKGVFDTFSFKLLRENIYWSTSLVLVYVTPASASNVELLLNRQLKECNVSVFLISRDLNAFLD